MVLLWDDPEVVGLAVQLLERGFAAKQVEGALAQHNTLEAALAHLAHRSSEEGSSRLPTHGSASAVDRVAPVEGSTSVIQAAKRAEVAILDVASSGAETSQSLRVDVRACEGDQELAALRIEEVPGLTISPGDATKFWRAARRRYRSFVAKTQVVVMPLEIAPEHQLFFPDSGKEEVAAKRPPATPCTAKRRRPLALSPFASPGTMQINKEAVSCMICCDDVLPCQAVRLTCGHGWYCAACVQRHTEACLSEGTSSVPCPECRSPMAERELRKLLPGSLMERLLTRSLEQAISTTSDLWSCPTPNCPMRVSLGEGEASCFRCTFCNKECCLRCGVQPFHKGLTCEAFARRRRKRPSEEDSFQKWMKETGTKQCPTCRMAVSKQNLDKQETQRSECHKMICRNCNTRFCFKCLTILTSSHTCGCSADAHGFVNPITGRRLNHLRPKKSKV